MVVILNDRTFESALPDVPRAVVPAMVMPRVCHRQRLYGAADLLSLLRLQDEMEMVVQQTIAKEPEGIALFGFSQSNQKREEVPRVDKYVRAIIPSIDRVVNQTVCVEPRQSSHATTLLRPATWSKKKMN